MPKQKKTRGLREEPGVHRIPRQLSAYNIYQQNLMRQGYSMKEAAQMWNELQQDIGKEEDD
jgi:SOS response regulatory protein OraA/RecX